MTGATAPSVAPNEALRSIQHPVRADLNQVAVELEAIVTADLPLIKSVSSHLLKMRGKLFRPTLALLSSATEGVREPRAVTVAAVIELMHLATLVHDDSVDHSVLRRGLPTVNSMFSHQVSVIMGDFLYSRALSALVRMGNLEILQILTDTSNELSVGEMRQLSAVERLGFREGEYYQLIRAKTASLIAAACETGALCGAPQHREALRRYGDRLGMAFQIADDILDYTEDESVTGKPGGLDIKERKVTLPLIVALPKLSPAARTLVDELFTRDGPDDRAVADVIAAVTEAGGVEEARLLGERFAQEAEEALAQIPESPVRGALMETIGYVMDRRS